MMELQAGPSPGLRDLRIEALRIFPRALPSDTRDVGCTLSASRLAGILGRELADRRPVEFIAAMGQQGQETVAQDVGER
jgi:hypothetical protein